MDMTIVRRMSLVTIHGWKTKQENFKDSGNYSFKSALIIAFIATILLWWLPIFGPMASGYVSGRISGNKWRGFLSTFIVSLVFGIISYLLSFHILLIPTYVSQYFNSSILSGINHVSPYVGWLIASIKVTLTDFNMYVLEIPPQWAVLIAFGFMGGAMSELQILDNERKSVLSQKHPRHNDKEAVKPKVVDYEPADKPHPLIKKLFKEKQKEHDEVDSYTQDSEDNDSDEYI